MICDPFRRSHNILIYLASLSECIQPSKVSNARKALFVFKSFTDWNVLSNNISSFISSVIMPFTIFLVETL